MTPMTRRVASALVMALAWPVTSASAQQDNPVYVDDSPQAYETLRRAHDHVADNAGEAVRLYQQLLDDYAERLAPFADGVSDHFVSVRQLVLDDLRSDEDLLARYRVVASAEDPGHTLYGRRNN